MTQHNESVHWRNMRREASMKALDALQDGAKQLVTITSTMLGLYLAAISFIDLKKIASGLLILPFALPVILWLASLWFAMQALLPEIQHLRWDALERFKQEYIKLVEDRFRQLKLAQWGFLLGLIVLLVNIVVYLVWLPAPPSGP